MMPHRESGTCDLCGAEHATGIWSGRVGRICICGDCALEALPVVIVDAAWLGRDSRLWTSAKMLAEQMLAAFWRAMTARAIRELGGQL